MKKIQILFIAIVSALILCSFTGQDKKLKSTERCVLITFTDYRKYAERGFMVSPTFYNGNYIGLGELYMIVEPALIESEEPSKYGYTGSSKFSMRFEDIEISELVDMAVNEAIKQGANAITNFKITSESIEKYNGYTSITAKGYRYIVSGFCIDRKDITPTVPGQKDKEE